MEPAAFSFAALTAERTGYIASALVVRAQPSRVPQFTGAHEASTAPQKVCHSPLIAPLKP